MGRVAPGQQNQNWGNEFMRMAVMFNQAKLDKEKAAYYGAQKESEIANRRTQMEERENKRLDKETEREFSQETGLPFKAGVDEPAVASLRATKRSEIPPPEPARRETPGLLTKLFPSTQHTVLPPPGEDPEITQGRIMGTKTAMVPHLYEQAQRQVQDMGYNDPKSKMYSPEASRLADTRTMRPEDVDKAARESAITKEHYGKAREQDIKASREKIGLDKDQRNLQLMDTFAKIDPKNTKARNEVLKQIAVNRGEVGSVVGMDDTRQKGYLNAVKQEGEAVQKLLEAQQKYPKNIDVHAGLAQEASAAALVAAEINESPMVDLITAMPYNKVIPFTGQTSSSNRVKVPTDYARANRDGIIESMIRAPLNPKDNIEDQEAQRKKQGEYLAWKIVHQNPEYLGNPTAFNSAIDKANVDPYMKQIAKQYMGTYMQMNPVTADEETEKPGEKLGPPTPEKWGFNLPGGKDPATGEAIPGPRVSDVKIKEGLAGILPARPKGGMFGTNKTPEDYIAEDQRAEEVAPRGGSFLEEPSMEQQPAMPDVPGPTGPVGPPRGSNLPTLRGVPRAGANIPPASQITPALVDAVIKAESSGNPNAMGKKGEGGLMQLMPGTAQDMGLQSHERFDGGKNREAGTKYLNQMMNKFGTVEKALAAYNWGPANLEKAIAKHGDKWADALPESTKRYIKKIMTGN